MNKKKTVGKIATDLMQKPFDTKDPIALEKEMHKDYEQNIYDCIARGLKEIPFGDFFIVIETKKEPLLPNVLRNYFFFRKSCPSPSYDNTLYHYHRSADSVEFLWVIPSKDTCELFKANVLQIVPEERQLLNYILDFEDGTLLKLAKRLNNEQGDSPLLEN